jgi:acyl-CoA synthetase (AMP-forming)/AMP-acid ligase II
MSERLPGYRTILEMLRANARRTPDKSAIESVDQGTRISWGELYAFANRFAHFLAARGIGANDRIMVLTENSRECLMLYYATLRHGATFCTANVEVNAAHLREMVARLRPKLVLWHEDIDGAALKGDAPGMPFAALFAAVALLPDAPELPPVNRPDDICVIGFTSGTSATPKGAMHSYSNYYAIGEQTLAMWEYTADDRVLEYRSLSWPSSHMLVETPVLMTGATVLIARKFSQSRFFDWIRDYRATVAIGIPTVVNMLLNRPEGGDGGALRGLRFMSCSTAPLLTEQHKKFEQRYGVPLVQIYGMSEGGVVAGNHWRGRRIGSVGKPGLYQNLRIVDEQGAELPSGQIGEIEIGGAQNGFGYLMEDLSIQPIRGIRLKTGDLGYLDAEGYLYVTGRAKDVIIRGGVNIAPLEIDNVLMTHPDIAEAATVGVPDNIYGEEIVAFVLAKPGRTLDAAAVLAHCARALPPFKRPRAVELVTEIPKGATGKIDRRRLAEAWAAKNAIPAPRSPAR